MNIAQHIIETSLINKKDQILLAVSGGSDSMALLHLMITIQKKLNIALSVAHLNHCLRGKKANQDEQFVVKYSKKHAIPVYSIQVDVKAFSKNNKMSLEEAARNIRYSFFQDICQKNNIKKIALAHTLDDNTETIIMNLLRGCGPNGLEGIPVSRQLNDTITLIRPLLQISKNELQTYCKNNKVPWREDHTNKEIDFTRNKLRKKIIPLLKMFNPALDEILLSLSSIMSAENIFLDQYTQQVLSQLTQKKTDCGIRIDTAELQKYPKAIQRRVVRLAIKEVQGDVRNIYLPFIENFLNNKLSTITYTPSKKLHVSKERL